MIAILLIGDEILSAQVRDENLHFMVSHLARIGYPTGEARIVRDDKDAIAAAFRDLCSRYEFVLSAGGIGPTHDDITISSLAYAFECPLVEHPKMKRFLERRYGQPLSPMVAAMAQVPDGTEIYGCEDNHWPVIHWRNVYVLPGLPRALKDKILRIVDLLTPRSVPYAADLYLTQDESEFADWLDEFRNANDTVVIGSYPVWGQSDYNSRLTIKGTDPDVLKRVASQLADHFRGKNELVRATDVRPLDYTTD